MKTKKEKLKTFFEISKEDFISKKIIKRFIEVNGIDITSETLNSYIKEFKEQKLIYSAGRGWYTTIEKSGSLSTEPVQKVVLLLEKEYPFLEFNCWSTEQIQPYFHHLLGKHLIYVYTTRDAISNITDTLRDNSYSILENPSKNELRESLSKLNIDVIVRASIEREPANNTHCSPTEKILIDLLYENNKGEMYSKTEIINASQKILNSSYCDVSRLIDYANRKRIDISFLIKNPTMQEI